MIVMPSEKLMPYIDIIDDEIVGEVPENLKKELEEFKQEYQKSRLAMQGNINVDVKF